MSACYIASIGKSYMWLGPICYSMTVSGDSDIYIRFIRFSYSRLNGKGQFNNMLLS